MKKELSLRAKTLISWGLFAVIFAVLLTLASLYDLQISKLLTKNSLAEGAYISSSGFGLFFEAIGSCPIYLAVSLVATVWFWWGINHKKAWLSVLAAIAVFVGFFMTFKDAFSYVLEAMSASANGGVPVDGGFRDSIYIYFLDALFAFVIGALLILVWKNVKPATNDKLFKMAFVMIGVLALYLIIHFVKGPVGRMRFRTMNVLGNFDNYTDWWVSNGKRSLDGMPSDNCKSFPSGHTFSAGVVYLLICIPDLLESWNKKWVKAVIYASTIIFTGLVAISRIVVGAHFMSDVLFGGTITFLGVMIMREIFIFKGAHFKALVGKYVPEKAADVCTECEGCTACAEDAECDGNCDACGENVCGGEVAEVIETIEAPDHTEAVNAEETAETHRTEN